MKVDQKAADAIDRLTSIPEFRTFVAWLDEQVAIETERAIMAADGTSGVPRGRAQFGVELLRAIQHNPETVKRMVARRR